MQGKADKVERFQTVAAFQTVQGNVILPHFRFHIRPRGKHALAPHIGNGIIQSVEDLHAEVGHADLIHIGEAEREADIDLVFLFDHAVGFAADVAPRLFHFQQEFFDICSNQINASFFSGQWLVDSGQWTVSGKWGVGSDKPIAG